MYYGGEKALQMSKSLLPCNRSKTARRNKQAIARKLRRKVKQELHKIKEEEDYLDSELKFDFNYDARTERSWMVIVRRKVGNSNPFIRWAIAKTKDIPNGEKYDYIKSILPGSGSIIKEHAMSHLEYSEGFERNPLEFRSRYLDYAKKKPMTNEDFASHLTDIVKDGYAHRLLNDSIKGVITFDSCLLGYLDEVTPFSKKAQTFFKESRKHEAKLRLLKGLHDVGDFLDVLNKANKGEASITFSNCELELSEKLSKLPSDSLKGYGIKHSYYRDKYMLYNPSKNHLWFGVMKKFVIEWAKSPVPDYEKLKKVRLRGHDSIMRFW